MTDKARFDRESRVEELLNRLIEENKQMFSDRMFCVISNGGEAQLCALFNTVDECAETFTNLLVGNPFYIKPLVVATHMAMERLNLSPKDIFNAEEDD